MPPLRERVEDIPHLLYHFLKTLGLEKYKLDEDALEFLTGYEWPGNIRELRNLAERIVVMHQGERIGRAALVKLLQKNPGKGKAAEKDTEKPTALPAEIMELNFNGAKECFEKHYLEFHLSRNNGIIAKTAEAIGVYPSNLHSKIRKHKLG
jgi:two-component system nitrogen regulation response regulator NtrX